MFLLISNLKLETPPNIFVAKRSAKKSRHFNITPKLPRQRQVRARPAPKPQPLALQKIICAHRPCIPVGFGSTGFSLCAFCLHRKSKVPADSCSLVSSDFLSHSPPSQFPVPCTRSISAPTARNFSTI